MQNDFRKSQLKNIRVKDAYDEKQHIVKAYFEEKRLNYTGFNLFIRAFKSEEKLEVWIKQKGTEQFNHLYTYDFCRLSGTLGPKRKEGDLQIPEGVYEISHFNPLSNFYLSLGINYPNRSDKILSDSDKPGSNIYIHGNCVTVGCIPITDEKIKELYVLAVEARNNGQERIPVHIFPSHLDSNSIEILIKRCKPDTEIINFWKNLQTVYNDFETSNIIKTIQVNKKGEYYF
jgi:murein L,D-transpeptidase YafK